LKAESITGTLSLGKEIALDVRVKSIGPAQAVEAEKALGVLGGLIREGIEQVTKMITTQLGNDPTIKDLSTILKAVQDGVKNAAFTTTGSETRVTVKIPADLPFTGAYTGLTVKAREAAANAQSANNLKQIAIAMHNYADTFGGAFPPAAVCD